VSYHFGSWQIAAPGAADLLVARTLLVAGVLLVAALLLLGLRRTADKRQADILSTLAVAVVLLSSRVFSPQYLLWLIGPVAVLLTVHRFRRPGLLGGLLVLCAASTHVVYPLLYMDLLALHVAPVVVLLVRTVLLVAVAAVLAAEARRAVGGDGHVAGAEVVADLHPVRSR
jgi:asparagine N-glycosylation enzyme membrane subunit Stt3